MSTEEPKQLTLITRRLVSSSAAITGAPPEEMDQRVANGRLSKDSDNCPVAAAGPS